MKLTKSFWDRDFKEVFKEHYKNIRDKIDNISIPQHGVDFGYSVRRAIRRFELTDVIKYGFPLIVFWIMWTSFGISINYVANATTDSNATQMIHLIQGITNIPIFWIFIGGYILYRVIRKHFL
jgi:hypothetical protein